MRPSKAKSNSHRDLDASLIGRTISRWCFPAMASASLDNGEVRAQCGRPLWKPNWMNATD